MAFCALTFSTPTPSCSASEVLAGLAAPVLVPIPKFEEFQTEIDWWGDESDGFASRVENNQAWKVSFDEVIGRNYNLDISNPYQGEVIDYDPNKLLADYAKQQQSIDTLRSQLKVVLGAALSANTTEDK